MDPGDDDPTTAPPPARASASTSVLAAAMLGLAEVLEPRPPRDLGVEVQDAPTDEPDLELTFRHLAPLDQQA